MSDLNMKELRARAKERGINSFGMKKADLIAALQADPTPEAPSRGPRETERQEAPRRRRQPLGGMQQKLNYPGREGYVRRWFNNTGGRIRNAEDAGYTAVKENRDGRDVEVSQRVGTNEDGSPMMAHLMEIRQEFYDEDQAIKLRVVDEIDAAIKGGEPRAQDAEHERYYTPSEGITVQG